MKLTVKQIIAESIATLDGPRGLLQTWGRVVRRGQGTAASLIATPFWLCMGWLGLAWSIYLGLVIAITFLGVWAIRIYESGKSGHDLPEVVIDEFVGMGISLFLIPMTAGYVVLAFGLFRLFDIWKPMGVKFFDDRHMNGWGVMLDDVVAGIYALTVVQVIAHSSVGHYLL